MAHSTGYNRSNSINFTKKNSFYSVSIAFIDLYIGGLINYFNPFQLSGLTVGSSYMLCVDLDGDGPLPLGPTGLEAWMEGQ